MIPQHSSQSSDTIEEENDSAILTRLNEDGTKSIYFDKRKLKIAPRSTLQFKVGPPFELVKNYYSVSKLGEINELPVHILPRIDRGFDHIDDEWVGYKRNYFTLVSSFKFANLSLDDFLTSKFQINFDDSGNNPIAIKYFAVKIIAKTNDESTEIDLVQHTAKRDKGPQFEPALTPLIPSPLPKHRLIREASNVRNSTKMKKYDSTFYFHRDEEHLKTASETIVSTYPNDCIQKVARYERVQFASSINVKKTTQQNRYFRLHVILGAVVEKLSTEMLKESHFQELALTDGTEQTFVFLQEMRTPPLIIRGRSPSNYTSSMRSSVRTNSTVKQNDIEIKTQDSDCILPNSLNRPSKRKSKVVQDITFSSSNTVTQDDEGDRGLKQRANERIQTLDHIEQIVLNQLPQFNNSVSNRASELQNNENILCLGDSVDRKSIGLRDIELKPTYVINAENVYVVGSLALTSHNILGSTLENSPKKRKLNCKEGNYNTYNNSKHSQDDVTVSDISFSILQNVSNNFYQFEHSSILEDQRENCSIPRMLNGATYSTPGNHFKQQEYENIKKSEHSWLTTFEVLPSEIPSEIMSANKLLEDENFFMH